VEMHDRRVAWMRARAAFYRSEAARLEAEADAAEAARAAGASQWGSDLPPLFLQMVLERMGGQHAWGAIRATCSTWCSVHDAWCPALSVRRWTAVLEDKLEWFQSVTTVDLRGCDARDVSSNLVELRSLPSLRTLELPASCTERAEDAEAVYGLTTLSTLGFWETRYIDDEGDVEAAGEWVLDLSRLTTLTSLSIVDCPTMTGEQMKAASRLTGLTELRLSGCGNVSTEGLCTVSRLTALTNLNLSANFNVTTEVLRAVSGLTALTTLNLYVCQNVSTEGLCTVSRLTALTNLSISSNLNVTTEVLRAVSGLNALNHLHLRSCDNVTDEGLLELRSLTALTLLHLRYCPNVTDVGKQALRTALPNLTIDD
jgi:hypothetical protein